MNGKSLPSTIVIFVFVQDLYKYKYKSIVRIASANISMRLRQSHCPIVANTCVVTVDSNKVQSFILVQYVYELISPAFLLILLYIRFITFLPAIIGESFWFFRTLNLSLNYRKFLLCSIIKDIFSRSNTAIRANLRTELLRT